MFDEGPEQFHQFIAPRSTLPLHLSFPLHASVTPNSFLPFDSYNPSPHHPFPLQANHLLHHHQSPTHTHEEEKEEENGMVNSINLEIERDQTQVAEQLIEYSSWTNDEVLALLKIRSSIESNWFPELTWDHVSRKLAELGFKRSAEKCKEKFEEESRYFNNNINKNYRFISELEQLYQGDPDQNPDDDDGVGSTEKTQHLEKTSEGHDKMDHALEEGSIGNIDTPAVTKQLCDEVVAKSRNRKRKKPDLRFEMFKGFCESIVNKMMAQQEEIHNKLLEDMLKRDEDKFAREEAWKKQELDRMNKELEMMAQEQAIAGDRQATIIEFLNKSGASSLATQNFGEGNGQDKLLKVTNGSNRNTRTSSSPLHSPNPNPSSSMILDVTNSPGQNPSSSLAQGTSLVIPFSSINCQNDNPLESNSVSTYKACSSAPKLTTEKEDVGRRWPRDEVLALINLRCTTMLQNNINGLDKEGNDKAPLWERISKGMSELGYKRSAKRCKEKWENINKYFRKTKDANKKRSLDSRTCPYFHQLSNLYSQGKLIPQSERPQNHLAPEHEQTQAESSDHRGYSVTFSCTVEVEDVDW